MSTVTAVVFIIWALPVVGITIAYFVLSRRVAQELGEVGSNRAVADRSVALQIVRSTRSFEHDQTELPSTKAAVKRDATRKVAADIPAPLVTRQSVRTVRQLN